MVAEHWPTGIAGTRFEDIEWVATVGSTNTVLMNEAASGRAEGRVLVVDVQTEGRGRRGRRWTAAAGSSLMMSVLLRPPHRALRPAQASLVTTAFALGAVDAVARTVGVALAVKWPNDLVVVADDHPGPGYRKIAGILTESVVSGGEIAALVVGMGMNTGWGAMPPDLRDQAASLDDLSGAAVSRPDLMVEVLRRFEVRYRTLLAEGGPAKTIEQAIGASATVGRRVTVDLGGGDVVVGTAAGLDPEGGLLLRSDAGTTQVVTMGEVVHLRPLPPS